MLKRFSPSAIGTRLILLGIALFFVVIFPTDTPAGNSLDERVTGEARNVLFNFVAWEMNAIFQKITQGQAGIAPYLTEAQCSQYVRDYFEKMKQYLTVNGKVDAIYSNPSIADPTTASADLRLQRDSLQTEVQQVLPLAESIIEEQISSVLRDEGLSTLGAILPPVSSHITELPMLLVVSPRDKIQYASAIELVNLTTDQANQLENSVDHDLNVSSLVVPIGGLSLYPSMVDQTWFAPYAFETVAHEWTHHYLYFFPLGLEYEAAGDTRTINETTAQMMGQEIARKTIERFYSAYPDILAELPPLTPPPTTAPTPSNPPAFDYGAVMSETRVNVDRLLADGKIDKAEAYMETQRTVFAANGYPIRKLNQAYFAFYGGYQSAGGASGSDPIGPAIVSIREHSPSAKAWLETMRSITTREELFAVRDSLNPPSKPNQSAPLLF